jgi:hypothetical protein
VSSEQPSSSAQALVTIERDTALRGLKTSFDELDDDDYAAIGRAVLGVTPRHLLSGVGAVLGAGAGVALTTVSVVGGCAAGIGVVAFAFVVGRRDLRARLVDHGLAPELTEAIFRTTVDERWRAGRRAGRPVDPWRLIPRAEDFVRSGRILVEAARADRER